MGLTKTSDGRYLVGQGIEDANDYLGSQGYRDIFIQLTADGATPDSVKKLEYLRDYAIYHSGLGEPVMPPSVQVWISNNGTTTAVEADDVSYTDGTYTICGIKYANGAWDYSEAGQGKGGGGGSSLPPYTAADKGKGLFIGEAEPVETVVIPEQSVTIETAGFEGAKQLVGADENYFKNVQIGDNMTLVFGAHSYVLTATELVDGVIGFAMFGSLFIAYDTIFGTNKVLAGTMGGSVETTTISATASVPSVEPKWEAAGGATYIEITEKESPYGLEINMTASDLTSLAETGAIVLGRYHIQDVGTDMTHLCQLLGYGTIDGFYYFNMLYDGRSCSFVASTTDDKPFYSMD